MAPNQTKVLHSTCHQPICKKIVHAAKQAKRLKHYLFDFNLNQCKLIQIDLNIFSTTKVVQGIFTVATFISYGLQCYVPVEIIWGNYLKKRFNEKLKWEFAVRITIVLVTCKCALFCFVEIRCDLNEH